MNAKISLKKQRIEDFKIDLIDGNRVNLKYLLVLVDRKIKLTITD